MVSIKIESHTRTRGRYCSFSFSENWVKVSSQHLCKSRWICFSKERRALWTVLVTTSWIIDSFNQLFYPLACF